MSVVEFCGQVPAKTPPALETDKWADVNSMSVEELRAELTAARERLCEQDKANRELIRMLHASVARIEQIVCLLPHTAEPTEHKEHGE